VVRYLLILFFTFIFLSSKCSLFLTEMSRIPRVRLKTRMARLSEVRSFTTTDRSPRSMDRSSDLHLRRLTSSNPEHSWLTRSGLPPTIDIVVHPTRRPHISIETIITQHRYSLALLRIASWTISLVDPLTALAARCYLNHLTGPGTR
jgi:hypothetical protein